MGIFNTKVHSHGQYCGAYFTGRLQYVRSFYCENFCCGDFYNKFCCRDKRLVYDQNKDIPAMTPIDITRWSETFSVMLGCVIGIICMAILAILVVILYCWRSNAQLNASVDPARRRSSMVTFDNTVFGLRVTGQDSGDEHSPVTIAVSRTEGAPEPQVQGPSSRRSSCGATGGTRKNSTTHKVGFYISDVNYRKGSGPLIYV